MPRPPPAREEACRVGGSTGLPAAQTSTLINIDNRRSMSSGRLRDARQVSARARFGADCTPRVDDPDERRDTTGCDKHGADHERLVERAHRLLVRRERVYGQL